MIHIEKIKALEELGLTREEALEWVDMLAQKKHNPWQEVVEKHAAVKYKTNCIICYRDKSGEFSYHRYVDTSRINEIYGFQFSPDWIMAIKDEYRDSSLMYHTFTIDEAREKLSKLYGCWQIPDDNTWNDYRAYYKKFLASEDCKIFHKTGICLLGVHTYQPYWTLTQMPHICDIKTYKPEGLQEPMATGSIRFFLPVKDVVVTE